MSLRKRMILSTKVGKKYFGASDFPKCVAIETTSDCNLRCWHCPRTYSNRPRISMSKDVFIKALEEIKREAPNMESVRLFAYGEPLKHPEIFDFIKLARKYLPNTSLEFSSNGALLTHELTKKILDSELNSIALWEKVGCKETEDQIKYFLEMAKGKKIKVMVGFLLFKNNKHKVREFLERYRPYLADNITLRIMETHDFAGQFKEHTLLHATRMGLKTPCQIPFNTVYVYATGEVTPCCMDMDAKLSGGKFPQKSIKEIWNGPMFANLRERLLEGSIGKTEFCYNCHYYRQSITKVVKEFTTGKSAKNVDVKK
jgi:MoaA/NifB/PqqE/SkfB family radical SAM enzyme